MYFFTPFLMIFPGQRFNNGHQEISSMMNPFGFGGFGGGFGSGFDNMFSMANNGYSSQTGVQNGGGNMKRTTISTRFSNGKKITTKRYVQRLTYKLVLSKYFRINL